MSFHLTSHGLHIENHGGRTHLVGEAEREDGSQNHVDLCLDDFIGNRDGHFEWDGENFTETAENVTFSIEGGGQVPVLRANLKNEEGILHPADVNLAERIENLNGDLVFQ